jgi:methyl-accepting chemotaxis protein
MKNLNIGKKIAVVFTIVLLISIAITGVGLWQLNKMTASTKELMALPTSRWSPSLPRTRWPAARKPATS